MINTSIRTRTRLISLLATAAVAGLVAAVGIAPAAAEQGPATAQAAKKKCGKKGKKGAAAAKKKCGKKKGGATGPSLPIGEWACLYSGMQTKPGNVYTINRTDPGTYTYNPANGIVTFKGGSYGWAYGVYYPASKAVEIYSNDASVTPIGTYGWTCSYFD